MFKKKTQVFFRIASLQDTRRVTQRRKPVFEGSDEEPVGRQLAADGAVHAPVGDEAVGENNHREGLGGGQQVPAPHAGHQGTRWWRS